MDHDDRLPRTPSPRRLGGAMIVLAWVVVIGVLGMLFGDLLEGQTNPNRDVETQSSAAGATQVRLRQNRQGHYVASGRINGEPVVFLVDTGATEVSVPERLARHLRLEPGAPARAHTANGAVTTFRTVLDSVQLGGITLHDVRAHINPGMRGEQVLLGMSFLRQLELVQRDGTLTLRVPVPG